MEGCLAGLALLVVPDNVWYGGVSEADVRTLVEQHLVGGEPVEMLPISPDDFCAQPQAQLRPAHYSQRRGALT